MREVGIDADVKDLRGFYIQSAICEHQLNWEKHIVIEARINRSGNTAPPRVIQACTESLDRKILQGNERFFLFANRAAAYFAQGDKQHALDDYNEAVKSAPRNADLYYNRGVFYVAQSDDDAALRDFDTAIGINSTVNAIATWPQPVCWCWCFQPALIVHPRCAAR